MIHAEHFSKDVVEAVVKESFLSHGRGMLLPNAGRARASEGNT
jgi:hypothetical protein